MSSASTLPFDPFDDAPEAEMRREIADRVAMHRRRKHGNAAEDLVLSKAKKASVNNPVAAAVAARYSNEVSYQDYLRAEAEAQRLQAEAEAEIARRNAEAIAQAQKELLEELAEWNSRIAAANAANPYYIADENAIAPATHPALVEMPVIQASEPATSALAEMSTHTVVTPAAQTEPKAAAVTAATSATAEVALNAAVARFEQTVSEATDSLPAHEIAAEAAAKPFSVAPPKFDPISVIRAELAAEPAALAAPLPTNLIEFPRQLVAARKARPRLAEGPLLEEAASADANAQLRIFEVEPDQVSREPEVTSVLPEWSSIRLESNTQPHERAEVQAQTAFVIHPEPAAFSDRVMATLVDTAAVTAAFLAFTLGVAWAAPEFPEGKQAAIAAGVVFLMLNLAYYMLFFSFGDSTPGMRYARVGFCTFSDENPSRKAIRLRMLSTVLAVSPMGLGILWALLDDEKLGWHDRISRMYPRSY